MTLPPAGPENSAAIVEWVAGWVRESANDPRRQAFVSEFDDGMDYYVGDQYSTSEPTDRIRLVLNRIQNCIISIVAVQAADPPRVTFTPRETGERPLVYLNTDLPEAQDILKQWEGFGHTIDPLMPLPDALAEDLKQRIEAAELVRMQAGAMGTVPDPGLPTKELMVEVSDQTCAEALQTIYDGIWEASDGQMLYAENILNKNVAGWQPTLIEWDDATQLPIFTNVHPKHVFPDRTRTDTSRAFAMVYDEPIAADEAKAKWPHLSREIEVQAAQGSLNWPAGTTYDPATPYQDPFERDMVVVRHAWVRFQPYPMTREQALASGRVQSADLPTGRMVDRFNPETGQIFQQEETRTATVLPGELQVEVAETDEEWPRRTGVRQITIVADSVVEDRECEFGDIPLPANKNIPIPYSPYGQGEPKRLKGLQQALNRVLSCIVTHHAYNAYPPEFMPQSVFDRMDKTIQKMRSQPGKRYPIPDDLITRFGDIKKLIMTLDVPSLPADFWKLLDFLISLIDKEGNQSDVMQGDASSTWSGEAIQSLQSAAGTVIRGKGMWTEFYLKQVVRQVHHAIITRMRPEDIRRYLSHLPMQAITAMSQKFKSLYLDISVEIRSASGASRQAETNNLVAARNAKLPVSDPTLMERMGLDPDSELTRQMDWERKRNAASQSLATQAQPAAVAGGPQQIPEAQQVTASPA